MANISSYLECQLRGKTVEDCIQKAEKLETKSKEGDIYKFSLGKTNTVFRVPKKGFEKNGKRAFLIGKELNKLRNIVPNFVYTFTQVHNSSFQEYIPGVTLEKALSFLTFGDFLSVFIQILLALEIAQRECFFCHYDLHCANVMLVELETPQEYVVVLDNKKYLVKAEKYLAVIIDFGLSSVQIGNKIVGSSDYEIVGIQKYLVQGFDAYKFLYYCYVFSGQELQKKIALLFLFYGSYDPYKILLLDQKRVKQISQESLKDVTRSYVATNTPEEFVSWILQYPDLSEYLNLSVVSRDVYHPNATHIPSSLKNVPSYVLSCYVEKITGYSKTALTSSDKEKWLISEKRHLIDQKRYSDIPLPSEFGIRDHANRILCTPLGGDKEVEKLIPIFIAETNFVDSLEIYLQYLYIIRELNLEIFSDFVSSFTFSEQYKLYDKLILVIQKTRRWAETLLLSMSGS